jgi:hypothetical protein
MVESGSVVPTGRDQIFRENPAMNRRATFGCPQGTFLHPAPEGAVNATKTAFALKESLDKKRGCG